MNTDPKSLMGTMDVMGSPAHTIDVLITTEDKILLDIYVRDANLKLPKEPTNRILMSKYQAEDLASHLFNIVNQIKPIDYRRIVQEEIGRLAK